MSEESEFGLVRSFGIDNGELDGLRPQECFVLGYELAQIDALIERGEPISKPVHAANLERIVAYLEKHKRRYSLTWAPNDSSESWMFLEVAKDERE